MVNAAKKTRRPRVQEISPGGVRYASIAPGVVGSWHTARSLCGLGGPLGMRRR